MKNTLIIVLVAFSLTSSISYAQTDSNSLIHFVQLDSKNIDLPIGFGYPQGWHVKVDNTQTPTVFVSREPVIKESDVFKVGVTAMYLKNYLMVDATVDAVIQELPTEKVIMIKEWDEVKNGFLNNMNAEGLRVNSSNDFSISGRKAFRMEVEGEKVKQIAVFVNDGAHMLLMTLEAPPGEYDTYKNVFDEMIKSLGFKNEI